MKNQRTTYPQVFLKNIWQVWLRIWPLEEILLGVVELIIELCFAESGIFVLLYEMYSISSLILAILTPHALTPCVFSQRPNVESVP